MFYSAERSVQILVSLLKQYGVKKIIASPGTTNIPFVGSVQSDPWFEIYSSVDERSAGYIACGMAAESGEPVVLTCTGATASRNYISALTEAFYNKLPIIAITSTQQANRIGHNIPQVIDRTAQMNDITKLSVQIPIVNNDDDAWEVNVAINKALIETTRRGGGPVHINLTSGYTHDFSVRELPIARKINHITKHTDKWPEINGKKVCIFVGNHKKWEAELLSEVERFCSQYNAVVICDHTSKYHGEYGVLGSLLLTQPQHNSLKEFDLLIDIGNISGAYIYVDVKETWRVNPDGEIRDSYHVLSTVFEMEEIEFFKNYNITNVSKSEDSLLALIKKEDAKIRSLIPELPFSNIWVAQQLSTLLPEDSVLHLGILNSLRSWNFFSIKNNVECYSNTGGFGIDGISSALIGASIVHPEKLYYGIIGDLAFFYDLNSLGNRNIGKNLRILLVNNGCGTEFKNYNHFAAMFGDTANDYMAAAGHFGNKSRCLVKHYVEDLGFEYISASNKSEFQGNLVSFLNKKNEKSVVFEIFTDSNQESEALKIMNNLIPEEINLNKKNAKITFSKVKKTIRSFVGENRIKGIKMIIKG